MMGALALAHRWLGILCCMPFAMWFASGIVMHFVPFPALSSVEKFSGLVPIDLSGELREPAAAVAASGLDGGLRVVLQRRPDGPVYRIAGTGTIGTLSARDLRPAMVDSAPLASMIAEDWARRRGLDVSGASAAEMVLRDQWTVAGHFDSHRPLYRSALNDRTATELYVSSTTGEVVLDTNGHERWWNQAGSIAHWFYPTALRRHATLWTAIVWTLASASLAAALAGTALGIARLRWRGRDGCVPARGLRAWHHGLGLSAAIFVLTFSFSGWLSMDNGLLFSTGEPTAAEATTVAGAPEWASLHEELKRLDRAALEVEWFAFGGRIYRRVRFSASDQILTPAGAGPDDPPRAALPGDEVSAAIGRLARGCEAPIPVAPGDSYAAALAAPAAALLRVRCGTIWFDVDAASGSIVEKLDPSRRAYRWLYRALHTLDFPVLAGHPALRTFLVVVLCGWGFLLSMSGVVMAGRELRSTFVRIRERRRRDRPVITKR